MTVDLFDFKKEKICTIPVGDDHVPFTLGLYIDYFKLSKVRLYMSTEMKDCDSDNDSEFSDSVFEQSPFDNQPGILSKQDDRVESPCSMQDSLIGTSKEREQLKNFIDEAYAESLSADQAKSMQAMMHDTPIHAVDIVYDQPNDSLGESLDELRKVRAGRLSVEPSVSDPHYIVSVRHPSLGVVTRLFSLSDLMFCVYDWIGSLHKSPKYFQLCKYSGGWIHPENSVQCADKCMLVMVECDDPVVFSSDEELIPRGFGPLISSPSPPFPKIIDPIPEECPTTIMVDDEDDTECYRESPA
jgi:hypothetical protein